MFYIFVYCILLGCNYVIFVVILGDIGSVVLNGFSYFNKNDKERIVVVIFFLENGVSDF